MLLRQGPGIQVSPSIGSAKTSIDARTVAKEPQSMEGFGGSHRPLAHLTDRGVTVAEPVEFDRSRWRASTRMRCAPAKRAWMCIELADVDALVAGAGPGRSREGSEACG